jgi:hypothetical protein
MNLEASRSVARPIALVLFADAGLVDSRALAATAGNAETTWLYDAGVGLTAALRLGDLAWTMRLEVPLVVNRFDLSADRAGRDARAALRWQVSLEPSF